MLNNIIITTTMIGGSNITRISMETSASLVIELSDFLGQGKIATTWPSQLIDFLSVLIVTQSIMVMAIIFKISLDYMLILTQKQPHFLRFWPHHDVTTCKNSSEFSFIGMKLFFSWFLSETGVCVKSIIIIISQVFPKAKGPRATFFIKTQQCCSLMKKILVAHP